MEIALLIISGIVLLAANIWLLIIGFQRSVIWGLAIFFIPFAALVFVVMYWQDAKKPFLVSLAASVVAGISFYLMSPDLDTEQLAQVGEGVLSGEIRPNEAVEQYGQAGESDKDPLAAGEVTASGEGAIPGTPMSDTTALPAEAGTTTAMTQSETMAMADEPTIAKEETMIVEDEPAEKVKQEEKVSLYPSPGNIKPDPLAVKKPIAVSPTIRVKLENIGSYKGRYFIVTTKDGGQHRGLLNKVSDSSLFLSRKIYGGNFEYVIAKKKISHVDMLKDEYVKEYMER